VKRWTDTPPGEIVWAEKIDGERVRFRDLRVGDVFRAIAPDGFVIDPETQERDNVWCRVTGGPIRGDDPQCTQGYGWAIYFERIDSPKLILN
jgi:hypothetical protein